MIKEKNISCNIIRDLLPLYMDDSCSPDSKKLVEEHIKECVTCQKEQQLYQTTVTLPNEDPDINNIKRGIRKIKASKTIGLIALAISLILTFLIIPITNYVVGSGITYTNLNDIHSANQFVEALSSGDYNNAYSYLDIEGKYNALLQTDYGLRKDEDTLAVITGIQEIKEKGYEWYNTTAKDTFMNNMQILESTKSTITDYSFRSIDRQSEKDSWCICYTATFKNGLPLNLYIYTDAQKITAFSVTLQNDSILADMNLEKYYNEIDEYLNIYYQMPTLNKTVCEILYDKTSYDWRGLFTRDIDVKSLFYIN